MAHTGLSFDHDVVKQWRNLDVKLLTVAVLPVLATIIGEAAIFVANDLLAMSLYFLTFLYCAFVPLGNKSATDLLVPFGLVSLFRLVNLGTPTIFDLTLFTLLLVYLPVLVAVFAFVHYHGGVKISHSPRLFLLSFVPAVVLAAVLGAGSFLLVDPESLVPEPSVGWILLGGAVLIFCVALLEELLFRGILQEALAQQLGAAPGIVLTSVLFGMMHSIYSSGRFIAFAGVLGLVYGSIYEFTRSIELTVLVHSLLNFFAFVVFPIYGLP